MSTTIEWTDETWNPIAAFDTVTGKRGWYCARVSAGCENCYAEKMNTWRGNGHLYRVPNADKVDIRIVENVLTKPLGWLKPRKIFVCSMTDLFLDQHSVGMIARVFAVMRDAPRHTFQVLTKRPEVMRAFVSGIGEEATRAAESELPWRYRLRQSGAPWKWPLPNVWLGTSVEHQKAADERIHELLLTPAAIRFLSVEPLLSEVNLGSTSIPFPLPLLRYSCTACDRDFGPSNRHLKPTCHTHGASSIVKAGGIDWVIVGGESGSDARPLDLAWARVLVRQCREAGVAVFVKQLGAVPMEPEEVWRGRVVTRVLNARNHHRVPEGFVPLLMNDAHGGDMAEWPEDLRVREFPTAAE